MKEKKQPSPVINEIPDTPRIPDNGVHYALSNGEYIDLGWTVLPEHKILRKEKVYYALPSKRCSTDWIARSEILSRMFYDKGELLAQFDDDNIKIFYKSGFIAINIQYYPVKGITYRRLVLTEDGCGGALLGVLDTLGRGVIYDHTANVRLKYNQLDAVLLDTNIGPRRSWKWINQTEEVLYENIINDTIITPPDEEIFNLVQQSKSTARSKKDKTPVEKKAKTPTKGTNKQPEPVVEIKKSSSHLVMKEIGPSTKVFKVNFIRPLIMKISSYFTLIISDQRNISLIFRYEKQKMRLELGVVLIDDLLEMDLIDTNRGATVYEQVPARTESIAAIQENLIEIKIAEVDRIERLKKLRIAQGRYFT